MRHIKSNENFAVEPDMAATIRQPPNPSYKTTTTSMEAAMKHVSMITVATEGQPHPLHPEATFTREEVQRLGSDPDVTLADNEDGMLVATLTSTKVTREEILEAIMHLEPMRKHDGKYMLATPINNAICVLQRLADHGMVAWDEHEAA